MRQDFLRQHGQRDRADMAASLRPLDDQRVRTRPDQAARHDQCGGEADRLRAAILDRADRRGRRDAAGQHDVADAGRGADADQGIQLRVHGDQVHPEWRVGAFLGGGDLGGEQVRTHRAAGDYAKAAGIGDGGDQVALADPTHRAAHDGHAAAQKTGAARPEPGQLGFGPQTTCIGWRNIRRHRARMRCEAHAPQAPCIRHRSVPRL